MRRCLPMSASLKGCRAACAGWGVSDLNEMVKALEHAGLTVFATDIHVRGVDDERGLTEKCAGAHLQVVEPLGVLKTLGVEDAFDGFLLGVAVLPDVFLGALCMVRSCMKRASAGKTTRNSSRPMLCMRCRRGCRSCRRAA